MTVSAKLKVILLAVCISVSCQKAEKKIVSQGDAVSFADLGFTYTPLTGMIDKTSAESRDARAHAASYTTKAAQLLLDFSSDEGDTAPEWHEVWVFILPRAMLAGLTDSVAESKLSASLAGPASTPVGQPQNAVLAGRSFLVTAFEHKEPPLNKQARIYTTICKTQIVAFVFVSNSADQLKAMEASMNTVKFSNQ
jgi:hypothetical protein